MINITRLRGGNAQFPEDKNIGDVVVLAVGEIFCWDGTIWKLLGGRFIPKRLREIFLYYIGSGWPDRQSAEFDLPSLLDVEALFDFPFDENDIVPPDKKMIDKFYSRIFEVIDQMERNQQKSNP